VPEVKNGKLAVARAMADLRQRFNQPVTLDKLASISGLSRFRLAHAFTKEVGPSPHAYQVSVRVERAHALLRRALCRRLWLLRWASLTKATSPGTSGKSCRLRQASTRG
jgi:hypothetical protein